MMQYSSFFLGTSIDSFIRFNVSHIPISFGRIHLNDFLEGISIFTYYIKNLSNLYFHRLFLRQRYYKNPNFDIMQIFKLKVAIIQVLQYKNILPSYFFERIHIFMISFGFVQIVGVKFQWIFYRGENVLGKTKKFQKVAEGRFSDYN